MTLDLDNTDKLAEFRREAQRLGIRVEPPSINRSGVVFDVAYDSDGRRDPLRARRRQGRRPAGGRGACRGARRARRSPTSPTSRGASTRALINKRTLENLIAAGALDELEPDRARADAAVDAMMSLAQRRPRPSTAACSTCSAASPRPTSRCASRRTSPGRRRCGCRRNTTRSASSSPAIRSTSTAHLLNRLRVQNWVDFCRSVKAGDVGRARRRDRPRPHGAPHQDRQQDGHRHAVRPDRAFRGDRLLGRAAAVTATCSSPAAPVLLVLQAGSRATRCGRASRRPSRSTRRSPRHQKGMRIFLRDERADRLACRSACASAARARSRSS